MSIEWIISIADWFFNDKKEENPAFQLPLFMTIELLIFTQAVIAVLLALSERSTSYGEICRRAYEHAYWMLNEVTIHSSDQFIATYFQEIVIN